MHCVVTGCAGFIGSHLSEALVAAGFEVTGIDCLTPYYPRPVKERNLEGLRRSRSFRLVECDLRSADVRPALADAELVFHQAGQPGVRGSWRDGFADYVAHNVFATQRLLEASLHAPKLRRIVYASSSSIYGNALVRPTPEPTTPRPFSPYGVTKLAGEHLVSVYAENWGLPTVSLRYFTVYGPRQRPDMAMYRFVEAALDGRRVPLFSDGEQSRDFTYVADVVAANIAAATTEVPPGTVLNVAGGSQASVNEVIVLIAEISGRRVSVERRGDPAGDVAATSGDVRKIGEMLRWHPTVTLEQGLKSQVAWHTSRRVAAAGAKPLRRGGTAA